MKLDTKHFGEIEIVPDKIIAFKEGVPGFTELKQFVLIAEPGENGDPDGGLFYWLQSVENPSIAFVMVDMIKYMPEYHPLVEETQMAGLGGCDPDQLLLYNIAVVPDNLSDATVNLKAPVVINDALKLGKQVICVNDEYTVRHYLFK